MKLSTQIAIAAMVTLLSLSSLCSLSGQETAHRFIDKVKQHKNTYAMTLPGWLVRTGINLAIEEDLKEGQGYKDIIKGIKQLRFVVVDDGDLVKKKHIDKLIRLSIEEDGMEEYVRVKEDGNRIVVLVKEKNDRIYDLLVISNSKDEFAIVNVKTNISLTELKKADFSFNENLSDN